jgi:hypothetical protein
VPIPGTRRFRDRQSHALPDSAMVRSPDQRLLPLTPAIGVMSVIALASGPRRSPVQGPGFRAVLAPGSRSGTGRPRPLPGRRQAREPGGRHHAGCPPPGPDYRGHRRERLGRKHRPHLAVADLPAADAGDRPELSGIAGGDPCRRRGRACRAAGSRDRPGRGSTIRSARGAPGSRASPRRPAGPEGGPGRPACAVGQRPQPVRRSSIVPWGVGSAFLPQRQRGLQARVAQTATPAARVLGSARSAKMIRDQGRSLPWL